MTAKEEQRKKEHTPHGLQDTNKTSPLQPGKTLHECPCGWKGWIAN